MPNSVRQDILTNMATCIPYITTTNGYANSLSSTGITKGFVSLNTVNEFPACFYGLAGETITGHSEDYMITTSTVEAYIGVYFQNNSGPGNLTTEMEEWIRDLKRFVRQDRAITGGKAKGLQLQSVDGVQAWDIKEVEPYPDYEKNVGTLLIFLEIEIFSNAKTGE